MSRGAALRVRLFTGDMGVIFRASSRIGDAWVSEEAVDGQQLERSQILTAASTDAVTTQSSSSVPNRSIFETDAPCAALCLATRVPVTILKTLKPDPVAATSQFPTLVTW